MQRRTQTRRAADKHALNADALVARLAAPLQAAGAAILVGHKRIYSGYRGLAGPRSPSFWNRRNLAAPQIQRMNSVVRPSVLTEQIA